MPKRLALSRIRPSTFVLPVVHAGAARAVKVSDATTASTGLFAAAMVSSACASYLRTSSTFACASTIDFPLDSNSTREMRPSA